MLDRILAVGHLPGDVAATSEMLIQACKAITGRQILEGRHLYQLLALRVATVFRVASGNVAVRAAPRYL